MEKEEKRRKKGGKRREKEVKGGESRERRNTFGLYAFLFLGVGTRRKKNRDEINAGKAK